MSAPTGKELLGAWIKEGKNIHVCNVWAVSVAIYKDPFRDDIVPKKDFIEQIIKGKIKKL